MPAAYLISRTIDPIFAVSVGVVAAAVRINREEKEKGKTTQETIESLKRRTAMLFGSDQPAIKAVEK
ncbi:hypothetical protein PRZ48_002964 [Zasmidium cellare]|uniref:Non-classical export protein 1 n=1 Tax=Zasmidium cellare TaxID=395010 RepID=A0ABR0EUY6_ZASCE|nr:hypothetical protein PRZ48_002964 [Zasmidium cellare]